MAIFSVFIPLVLSFALGLAVEPWLTYAMHKHRLWKKSKRIDNNPDEMSPEFIKLYEQNNLASEIGTPRVGGMIVWSSVILAALVLVLLQTWIPSEITRGLDFTSRSQTLIPFVVFIVMAGAGLVDDLVNILVSRGKFNQGIPGKFFVAIVTVLGLFGGWWFYAKLGVTGITIPIYGFLHIGWLIIPLFMIVAMATFSSGVIDGIDGLASGVLAIIFAAYGTIALVQGQIDLAALCFAITGSTLAFLWFNVPPARFYLGETGMLALTSTLTFVAFLTDKVIWLPLIAFPLAATAFSSAVQIAGKKYFNIKVFKVAPIHHHFEALGWSRPAIVMRYWIITLLLGVLGVLLAIVTK
jgi:phospho-N-acetylmuramoyl-pentapeptide-transferase